MIVDNELRINFKMKKVHQRSRVSTTRHDDINFEMKSIVNSVIELEWFRWMSPDDRKLSSWSQIWKKYNFVEKMIGLRTVNSNTIILY